MDLQLPKGVRDFPPEEQIFREQLMERLKRIFERYGFNPLETPVFERFEVLSAKYAGGAEILKETFKFTDQGGRQLALRYDLTVPFARYVGMNPQLRMPFKRYAIGRVFRDGPIKLGRYREFYQCDVDVVGTRSMLADAECARVAIAAFAELGIPVVLAANNRKLLEDLLTKGGVSKELMIDAMLTLDKVKKIPLEELKKELAQKGIPEESVDFVIRLAAQESGSEEKLAAAREYLGAETEGCRELAEFFSYLKDVPNVAFDPSLTRGLAYYTGTVFEGFAQGSRVTSSVCGGGRYDNMIGQLLESEASYPAVGISFGLEPIMEVLKERGLQARPTVTRAYVIPIKTMEAAAAITERIRLAGVNADMDPNGRSISKNLDYANSYKIPFVVIVGQRELAEGKVKLKDMESGEEQLLSIEEAIERLRQG